MKKMILPVIIAATMPLFGLWAKPYRFAPTEPSMKWAFQLDEMDAAAVVSMKPVEFGVVESEGGVMLEIPGTCVWPEAGQPRLPSFAAVFEVAEDISVQVAMEPGREEDQPVGMLWPMETRQSVSVDDASSRHEMMRVPKPAIYENPAFWPGELFKINEARGLGKRYVRVAWSPFQYHPVEGVLRHYPEMKLTIQFMPNEAGEDASGDP